MSQLRAKSVRTPGSDCSLANPDRVKRPRSLIIGAGATYHVVSRGVRRLPIFYDDLDRAWFSEDLTRIVRDLGWRCHAYCLMSNHYHLLVRTPDPDLSVGMWRLNQRHALQINRRHNFVGHVFEGRFFAELIENDRYFVAVARYIDQNPVRATICRSAEAWAWSGCAATLGLRRRLPRRPRVLLGRPRVRSDDVRALPPGLQPAWPFEPCPESWTGDSARSAEAGTGDSARSAEAVRSGEAFRE